MSIFYSKSAGGFYDNTLHTAAQIPSDAVAVPQATYQALIAGQSPTLIITADVNGNPVLTTQVYSSAQLWSQYQQQAQAALTESDKTILRCAENSVTVPATWATYRKALRTIVGSSTGTPGTLPSAPTYPAGT